MQNVEGAVIAAAGLGSRLGLGMPKCMIEINGVPILDRLLDILRPSVSVIHVVVGYREEMVIEYCAKHHPDVVLVRNPQYRTTNTAYSFARGAAHLRGKVVYMDGDLIICPESFREFLSYAKSQDVLIGFTDSKSENAVFLQGEKSGNVMSVTGFSRDAVGPFEWANVMVGPSDFMKNVDGYVFEHLRNHLPTTGHMLELVEVDTSEDLQRAMAFSSPGN